MRRIRRSVTLTIEHHHLLTELLLPFRCAQLGVNNGVLGLVTTLVVVGVVDTGAEETATAALFTRFWMPSVVRLSVCGVSAALPVAAVMEASALLKSGVAAEELLLAVCVAAGVAAALSVTAVLPSSVSKDDAEVSPASNALFFASVASPDVAFA